MPGTPTLGPRGEGWVVLQIILLFAVGIAGRAGPSLASEARVIAAVVGAALFVGGAIMVARGGRDLGAALTPLPHPKADADLVETGIYARVRHPIYGGIVLAAVGWACVTASIPAALLAVVTWGFFRVKSVREEAWLAARHPGYSAYRDRTRRLIPWIG